jgi:PIN domain nuclease of toxin-antitoxin system
VTTLLDASALLAAVNGEVGAARVAECLRDAAISTVNLAEVASKLADFGWQEREIEELVADLQLAVVPFERADSFVAARLKLQAQKLGLSLGDRACLATAMRLGYPVLTADKVWSRLKLSKLKIEVLR